MVFAIASIAIVWAALLGTAYLARVAGGLSRRNSALAVSFCYVGLAVTALSWLGHGWSGIAGAFGMLVPYATALALVAIAG